MPPATGGWAELDGLATTPPCDDPRGWARRLAHLDVDPRHCHAEADPFTQRVRAAEIMDNPLQAISRVRARFAILDMTDVELIDTSTASHLPGLVRAIQLLGS